MTHAPVTISHSKPHQPANPLTPKHTATTVIVKASAETFRFEYQYNPAYTAPKPADFAHALLLDADAYDDNPFTFAHNIGFQADSPAERQRAFRAWNACHRAAKFVSALTQQERDYLNTLAADD